MQTYYLGENKPKLSYSKGGSLWNLQKKENWKQLNKDSGAGEEQHTALSQGTGRQCHLEILSC